MQKNLERPIKINNMDEEKLERIWGSVGFIMHLSQLIEYNIVNIIAGHKFLKDVKAQKSMNIEEYERKAIASNKILRNLSYKKTMGNVINAAKDIHLFDEELTNKLDAIKEKRDYYAHIFFKEQLFTKDMENNPNILLDQLSQDVNDLKEINDKLLEIDAKQRQKAKRIGTLLRN